MAPGPEVPGPRPRRWRWTSLAALTGVVLLVLAGAVPSGRSRPDLLEAAAGQRATTLETGVEVFSMWRDWPVNTEMLDRIAATGAGWVRIGVGWCSLEEAGPGVVSSWYQDRLDATVDEAGRRGLRVLATLGCTPHWLSGSDSLTVLPGDPAQYERVARYLASRYAGRVAAWELWNEPDCATGVCREQDPAAYVPLLRSGHAGIKAGDPAAVVVSGGTSGINAQWVEAMYAAGAQDCFDAVGVHPYQGPAAEPPEAPPADHPYRMTNVEGLRELMVAHGDAAKPIWFTEFGWTTGAGSGWSAGVDEATQADYLRRAIVMIQDQYPYVTHAFVFTVRDRDDWSAYENNFGLLHVDGTPKPALGAFQQANEWLADQRRKTPGPRRVKGR